MSKNTTSLKLTYPSKRTGDPSLDGPTVQYVYIGEYYGISIVIDPDIPIRKLADGTLVCDVWLGSVLITNVRLEER